MIFMDIDFEEMANMLVKVKVKIASAQEHVGELYITNHNCKEIWEINNQHTTKLLSINKNYYSLDINFNNLVECLAGWKWYLTEILTNINSHRTTSGIQKERG